MTDVASLPGKWRDIARRLDGIERPSIAELARAETYRSVASHLESALAALSPAPSAGVEWRWVDEKGRAMTKWNSSERPPMEGVSDAKGYMRVETRPAAPSVSPAVEGGLPELVERDQLVRIRFLDQQGRRCTAYKTGQEIGDVLIRRLASSAPQGEVEPHCSGHGQFDYDCIDCSDALERKRKGLAAGNGTYPLPPAPAAEQPQGEMVLTEVERKALADALLAEFLNVQR